MLFLNADHVRKALPMGATVEAMKRAFAALSDGNAEVPLRLNLPVAPNGGQVLFMPAYVKDSQGESLAVKIVSLFANNPAAGLPFIHAAVLVLNPTTGKPEALLEGGTLTAIRTGAAGGVGIDLLARPDSRTAAIFGAGVQARTQLEAACAVRRIREAWIYDPDSNRVTSFIETMNQVLEGRVNLHSAGSPAEALIAADIVCTATTSQTPVFADADLRPGTHISGVGSYTPAMQEIPAETVRRARVYVDSRTAALTEAGDLIQPLQAGLIPAEHILGEIGEVVLGRIPGRTGPDQITFFKSVGVAVQDAAAAALALANAHQMGLGRMIEW
jgi:ornithine cyclodeaminase